MRPAPIPESEPERLRALARYDVLDTSPERAFDDIARIAASVLGTPIALVSLVDADRQWFKARYGLEATQTPRDVSFCAHVVAEAGMLVVPDALADERFHDNSLVTGAPHVRFYAGAPLSTPDGYLLGSLCAIDQVPREATAEQLELLDALARQVITLLESRRQARENATYRRLFDAGLSCTTRVDGFLLSSSPGWNDLLGRTTEELHSRPFADFMHPDDVAPTVRHMADLAAGTEMVAFENRYLHANGSVRSLMWNAMIDRSAGLVYAVARNLTDLIERETSLRESDARHRALVDNLGDGVVTIDERGIIERINPMTERIFGYRAEETVGQNVKMLMPSQIRREHDGYLRRYLAGGPPGVIGTRREVVGLRKDGREVPLELSVSELVLTNRRLFLGVVRDISERKQSAAQLHSLLAMQRAILEGAAYAIIAVDTLGLIQAFNPAAELMLGYSADEVVGKLTPSIFHLGTEVERRAAELREELGLEIAGFEVFVAKARLGQVDEREWTYVRKDGTSLPVTLSVSALQDEAGVVTGFLGIAADISERKSVERLQSEFVSTVSHELRTPLTAIRGSLGLLAGGALGELPPKADQMVRLGLSNCERLGRLINDILDVERLRAGKVQFSSQVVELGQAVETALAANRQYAAQFEVSFSFSRPTEATDVSIDPDRFAQVLANLLSNAAKFSPRGGVVDVVLERTTDHATISVRDRGRGIPAEFAPRIFERFSQVDASDSRQRGGTGLGLNITRDLVLRMGGSIGFHDADGGGTRFYVEFPVAHPTGGS